MRTVYALLAGINEYLSPDIQSLRGCLRDVDAAQAWLTRELGPDTALCVQVLRDGQATRDAVIDGIRTHLGQTGPPDTALFWFSGHGSEAECPEWAWFAEPSTRLQTLVCADSRTPGVPDLWDKELSVLLDEVAVRAGHVAVVLDSCHSGGATRGSGPTGDWRSIPPDGPRDAGSLVRELTGRTGSDLDAEHIALAACRSFEKARETRDGGVFSVALLSALRRLESPATYRDLALAARTDLEQRGYDQVPQLYPATSWLTELPFLGGDRVRPGAAMRMRYGSAGWEIDAGAVHGLPRERGLRIGVRGARPAAEAEVTDVQAHRSAVTPVDGWQPARDSQLPVVVTRVPMPPRTVRITGAPDQARRLADRLADAGPDGGPSPHVRAVAGPADLEADIDAYGTVRIRDHESGQLVEIDLDQAVPALEHIARWTVLAKLENFRSELTGLVRLEVVTAGDGVALAPPTGGVTPAADGPGGLRLEYRWDGTAWWPPEVFIRLHNTSDRRLYCALLDLTPAFQVHASLFPGDFIGPGARGAALRGRRIQAFLPDGVTPVPGVRVRDRLKLLVAEEQFSAEPFLLPRMGGQIPVARGALDAYGLLERIGGGAIHRDLGAAGAPTSAYDWTAETLILQIAVP